MLYMFPGALLTPTPEQTVNEQKIVVAVVVKQNRNGTLPKMVFDLRRPSHQAEHL